MTCSFMLSHEGKAHEFLAQRVAETESLETWRVCSRRPWQARRSTVSKGSGPANKDAARLEPDPGADHAPVSAWKLGSPPAIIRFLGVYSTFPPSRLLCSPHRRKAPPNVLYSLSTLLCEKWRVARCVTTVIARFNMPVSHSSFLEYAVGSWILNRRPVRGKPMGH